MTFEQAYKECKDWFNNDGIGELDAIVFNMALNALEKQIPKRVIVKKYDIGGNDYFCPCGNKIQSGLYCPDCGQALDWSDND